MTNDEKATVCVEAFKPLADMAQQFTALYLIEFADDGPAEGQCLHVGTKAECDKVASLISVVSYSGDRPVKQSSFFVCPQPDTPMHAGQLLRVTAPASGRGGGR